MTPEDIYAYDRDVGIDEKLIYSINSNPGGYFDINPINGEIILKRKLPDSHQFEYNLIIKVI